MITEEKEKTAETLHAPGEAKALQGQAGVKRLVDILLLSALALLVIALALKLASNARTSAEMFTYPFQFDESEGMIVAETMLADHGTNIYDKLTPDLFIAAPYPPLFYLLDWPFQHFAGDDPTFKAGRALSILATLLAGVALFGIVSTVARDRLAGALAALAFLSLDLVVFWGDLVKPDMLALAFGLLGLWWLVARPHSQVWVALPLFLAAFYTKQTAIAAGVAAVGWLLITRWRTGLAFGVVYVLGAALPTLALNWWTDGGYFYHMFTVHNLPWFPGRYIEYMGNLLTTYGSLLLPGMLAIVFAAGLWLAARLGRGKELIAPGTGLLILFYLVMTWVSSSGTGTHGGNHNHLLDLAASSCLGLGVGVALVRKSSLWQVKLAGAALAVLVLAQVPSLFNTPPWLKTEFSLLSPDKRDGMLNVFQYVTNNSGQAYSDNVGLLVATHKHLWTTDPFTQTHATSFGRWDETKLVAAIRSKSFAQIVFRIDVFGEDAGAGDVSPGILQAVRDNYKLDQRNVENIYVPR